MSAMLCVAQYKALLLLLKTFPLSLFFHIRSELSEFDFLSLRRTKMKGG